MKPTLSGQTDVRLSCNKGDDEKKPLMYGVLEQKKHPKKGRMKQQKKLPLSW